MPNLESKSGSPLTHLRIPIITLCEEETGIKHKDIINTKSEETTSFHTDENIDDDEDEGAAIFETKEELEVEPQEEDTKLPLTKL